MNSLFDDLGPEQGPLERAFWKFHSENPRVYSLICKHASAALSRGFARFSMKMVFELVRYHEWIVTNDRDFKLNNNYHAFYARLWMNNNPQHDGFFRTRKQKIESTF